MSVNNEIDAEAAPGAEAPPPSVLRASRAIRRHRYLISNFC